MKRWMSILATLIFAVCLSASAKDNKKNVERGMSQQEVINILGDHSLKPASLFQLCQLLLLFVNADAV